MFTQCPDCDTAFRITAEVLKRAAGQVRCGGCGIAFNALEHLSEEMPKSALRARPNERVPELTPEDDEQERSLPRTISARQSAALLKTLDELAGSNIQIEDTGAEWRVLDSDSSDVEPSPEDQAAAESQLIKDTGSMKFVIANDDEDELSPDDMSVIFEAPSVTSIDSNLERDSGKTVIDEVLTDSPTPVDEILTATPSRVESPEVFTDAEANPAPDVMRFDDNTPLPEDFGLGDPTPYNPEPPAPVVERRVKAPDFDLPVDLALGDPDEWQQLLGEVDEPGAEQNDAVTAEIIDEAPAEESGAPVEIRNRTVADSPPDMDTQFAIQAEAMGIDLSGIHSSAESGDAGVDDPDVDEPGIDDQDELRADAEQDNEEHLNALSMTSGIVELELEPAAKPDDETDEAADQPGIVETEDVLDEDETLVTGDDVEDPDPIDTADGEDLKLTAESGIDEWSVIDALDNDALGLDDETDDEPNLTEGSQSDDFDPHADSKDVLEDELQDDEPETSIDEDLVAAAFESEAAQNAVDLNEDPVEGDADTGEEHYVPPQTEEEMTINMMIDQDFMRLAAEGEDIFTSTTVGDHPDLENHPSVETIVMEGEFVRTALDREKLAADAAVGSRRYGDTKFSSTPAGNKAPGVRGGRRETDPPAYGLIAAALLLGLILVGQVLHQSREALATVPEFNEIVGPIYRMAGRPLTPAWDISGWRFEAATSKLNEVDGVLTIYARIGNTSDSPLPYPLVHLSLIDLELEIIGSKVLEPSQYLAGNPDPRKPVAPGDTFDAIIAVESAPANADGFKLDACYRLANRQLRCAIEDFK